MADLSPRSFDIETQGFSTSAEVTVAGLCNDDWAWLVLNSDGREADASVLESKLQYPSRADTVRVTIEEDEEGLLRALLSFVSERIDADRHYLSAYNAETWNGGFDLPFLRTRCAIHDVDWPFSDLAYVDVRSVVSRFNTGDSETLETAYEVLIGDDHRDPFDSSEEAVEAFEDGNWEDLLAHNLSDIRRTQELVRLGERYVPRSDFSMKSLDPPGTE